MAWAALCRSSRGRSLPPRKCPTRIHRYRPSKLPRVEYRCEPPLQRSCQSLSRYARKRFPMLTGIPALAAQKLAEMERQSERLREMLGAWRNSSRRPNACAIMHHANQTRSKPRRDRQGSRSSEAICAKGSHDRTDSGADRMPKLHRLLRYSHFETAGRRRGGTKSNRVRPKLGRRQYRRPRTRYIVRPRCTGRARRRN